MSYDVVVVGAGHAGLAASYFLNEAGLPHVVFERGRIAESWRSQRWDSFYLNTPRWCSHLPGDEYAGGDPDAFYHRDQFVDTLESYVERFALPVESGVSVTRLRPAAGRLEVTIRPDGGGSEVVETSNVIVASGIQNVPRIPNLAHHLPTTITQIHSADYAAPDQLPSGAVLVVGAGQSGFQIAEDLLEAGREVYFSSSRVGRLPRRHRGRDILYWMGQSGMLAQRTTDLEDRSAIYETIPHVSGVGLRGRTVSYQHLARCGATILGRLAGFEQGSFTFHDDAADNVRFADSRSAEVRKGIDEFLKATGREIPPQEDDPRDDPDPDAACASSLTALNANTAGITSIVWCTGFRGSFDWIEAPVLAEDGRPANLDGVSPIPGLYYLGFPWLRNRKSGIITGVGEDAAHIVSTIALASSP